MIPFLDQLHAEARHAGMRAAIGLLVGLAILAALPYIPMLNLPLIADDYDQINKARIYGPASGWPALSGDALYRCRATSLVLTHWTEGLLGIHPVVLHASSVLLHILNTWLVFAFGLWPRIGWRVSATAAVFFAVYHGHHEAVTWYAAVPELLVFFCIAAGFLLWIAWLHAPGLLANAAVAMCFMLALLSKESGVALVPLIVGALIVERGDWLGKLPRLLPVASLAVLYFAWIYVNRAEHQHFWDGTFSLHAPVLLTLLRSSARMFWFWGLISLVVLLLLGARRWSFVLSAAFVWVIVGLLPYAFLTYMPFVPSRHTYLASAGLALVVAAASVELFGRLRQSHRWLAVLLAAVLVVHNCGYVWTKKRAQMMARAAPTEALVSFAQRTNSPIYLRCFPYAPEVALLAVEIRTGKPRDTVRWDPVVGNRGPGGACWSLQPASSAATRRASSASEERGRSMDETILSRGVSHD